MSNQTENNSNNVVRNINTNFGQANTAKPQLDKDLMEKCEDRARFLLQTIGAQHLNHPNQSFDLHAPDMKTLAKRIYNKELENRKSGAPSLFPVSSGIPDASVPVEENDDNLDW